MSKPKFDPNAAYEPVTDAKPKFDPNAAFEPAQDAAAPQAPAPAPEEAKAPGFGPTADGSVRNPMDVDWLGAIKNEFTKEPPPGSMVADNPFLTASGAPATAGVKALGAVAKPVMGAATQFAQKFATSPLPAKISNATNVTGAVKGLVGKASDIFANASPGVKKAADVISGAAGRHAAYSSPLAPIQGISDAAKAVQGAQKGVAWVLDNAPQKLGKFAPALQKAAAAGGTALATTDFLLQQTEPEYQAIKKDIDNQ